MTLFKKLYLTRRGADKIFIEASDKDNEENKVDEQIVESDTATLSLQQIQAYDEEQAQFHTLLMGIEIDKLKECLTAVSKEKAQEYLKNVSHQQQIADSNKGMRAYISSWIFTQPAADANQKPGTPKAAAGGANAEAMEEDEFLDAVESQEQLVA